MARVNVHRRYETIVYIQNSVYAISRGYYVHYAMITEEIRAVFQNATQQLTMVAMIMRYLGTLRFGVYTYIPNAFVISCIRGN